MSTHPNAMLLLMLTPDGLARKTYRAIVAEAGLTGDDIDFMIAGEKYHSFVAESDYKDGYQIATREGQIVLFDLVTYGYGETITWVKLEAQKQALETWAKAVCEKHRCTYEILVSANYW